MVCFRGLCGPGRKENKKLEQNKRFYRKAAASCQQEASGEDGHSVDGRPQYTVPRDINPRPVGRTCTPAPNTRWFERKRWYEVGQGTSAWEELNQRQPGGTGSHLDSVAVGRSSYFTGLAECWSTSSYPVPPEATQRFVILPPEKYKPEAGTCFFGSTMATACQVSKYSR